MTTDHELREDRSVTGFKVDEHVPRGVAAERLVDIAYALPSGMLELRAEGAEVHLAVADEVLVRREARSDGERIEVAVVLSWPA